MHVPNGEPQFVLGTDPSTRRGDKPTSLLALGDTLVLAGHAHMAMTILYGYIAISEDLGTTWTEIPGSPWTGGSKFKRMMFINMGRGYSLNEDGMVYGIGIASDHGLSDLYLARVPVEQVTNYDAYSYFAGFEGDGSPIFVPRDESVAAPLAGPKASMQGGVIFHPGIQRYLMLIPAKDFVLELWEAPEPWGPWFLAQRFESEAYAPAIISKDTGPDFFYFTGAGGAGIGDTYQLNISRIVMTLK
ncbi:MAG: DUF4185 domain-containing protein [Deltaproteobacteria bacterium]|nr:MAG: DUF4185 domain-containing protein [Deltaproteobacteria bacterium]